MWLRWCVNPWALLRPSSKRWSCPSCPKLAPARWPATPWPPWLLANHFRCVWGSVLYAVGVLGKIVLSSLKVKLMDTFSVGWFFYVGNASICQAEMCTYRHKYALTCMHALMHAQMYSWTLTHTNTHTCMHACMRAHTSTHTCMCIWVHTHTHTHTHTNSAVSMWFLHVRPFCTVL